MNSSGKPLEAADPTGSGRPSHCWRILAICSLLGMISGGLTGSGILFTVPLQKELNMSWALLALVTAM